MRCRLNLLIGVLIGFITCALVSTLTLRVRSHYPRGNFFVSSIVRRSVKSAIRSHTEFAALPPERIRGATSRYFSDSNVHQNSSNFSSSSSSSNSSSNSGGYWGLRIDLSAAGTPMEALERLRTIVYEPLTVRNELKYDKKASHALLATEAPGRPRMHLPSKVSQFLEAVVDFESGVKNPYNSTIDYLARWYKTAMKWQLLHGDTLSTFYKYPNKSSFPWEALYHLCTRHESRIICVGDVHGCAAELCDLLRTVEIRPGDVILLLGDLVEKGPASASTVRLAREIGALAVRGNHDHRVLRQVSALHRRLETALLSGEEAEISNIMRGYPPRHRHAHTTAPLIYPRLSSALIPLPMEEWTNRTTLTLNDLEWMCKLPVYFDCPDLGSLMVHAGFQVGVPLPEQDPAVMMTLRCVLSDGRVTSARGYSGFGWAAQWTGPAHVYFGHDAARGLRRYPYATGLDSACVYGGTLSAAILPHGAIVSIPARQAYLKKRI